MEELTKKSIKLANEAEIIERAKTDDQAFGQLYDYYFPQIYGYLFKRVGNREATEDLVSEVFIKVFSNIKKYQARGYSFSSWLYRIATNNLIDYYRREGKKEEVDLEEITELPDSRLSITEEMITIEERREIKEAIGKLPRRHQEVLNLRFFAELSHEEVAATLKVSVNNARVLTFRALKNFEKRYKKYGK